MATAAVLSSSAEQANMPPAPAPSAQDLEPDEAWKGHLRYRIEQNLRSMVEQARQDMQDKLSQRPLNKSEKERTHSGFQESMENIRRIAQEQFDLALENERMIRRWANGEPVDESVSEDLIKDQQAILASIENEKAASADQRHGPRFQNLANNLAHGRRTAPRTNQHPMNWFASLGRKGSLSASSPDDGYFPIDDWQSGSPHGRSPSRPPDRRGSMGHGAHPGRPRAPSIESQQSGSSTGHRSVDGRRQSVGSESGVVRKPSFVDSPSQGWGYEDRRRSNSNASAHSVSMKPEIWRPSVSPEDRTRPLAGPSNAGSQPSAWNARATDTISERTEDSERSESGQSDERSDSQSDRGATDDEQDGEVSQARFEAEHEQRYAAEQQYLYNRHGSRSQPSPVSARMSPVTPISHSPSPGPSRFQSSLSASRPIGQPPVRHLSLDEAPTGPLLGGSPNLRGFSGPPSAPAASQRTPAGAEAHSHWGYPSVFPHEEYGRQNTLTRGNSVRPRTSMPDFNQTPTAEYPPPSGYAGPQGGRPIARKRSVPTFDDSQWDSGSGSSPGRRWHGPDTIPENRAVSRSPGGSRWGGPAARQGTLRGRTSTVSIRQGGRHRRRPGYEDDVSSESDDYGILDIEHTEDLVRRERDAERKEEELRKKEEETKKLAERLQQLEEELRRREDELGQKKGKGAQGKAEGKRKDAEMRDREQQLQRQVADAKRKEEEIQQKEEEARKKEEELRKIEEEARKMARQVEEDARRMEEAARRRMEEDARKMEEEANQKEEEMRRKEEELEAQQEELRAREEGLRRLEAEATQKQEQAAKDKEEALKLKNSRDKQVQSQVAEARRKQREAEQREREAKEEAKKIEEEAKRIEEEAKEKARQVDEESRKKEEEWRQREEELSRREAIAFQREEINLAQEERLKEHQRRRQDSLGSMDANRNKPPVSASASVSGQPWSSSSPPSSTPAWAANSGAPGPRPPPPTTRPERAGSTTSGTAGDRSSTASSASWNSQSSAWTQSSRTSASSTGSTPIGRTGTPASGSKPSPAPSWGPGGPGPAPSTSAPSSGAAPLSEAEWARRQEEQARRQQEAYKRAQEQQEREREARNTKVMSRDQALDIFEKHDEQWAIVRSAPKLRWDVFPWPTFKPPKAPEDITTNAVSAYVLSPLHPRDCEKSNKDRVRDHIKRWHPDRFETQLLPKVNDEEREKVKEGAGQVARALSELLTRTNVS